MTNMLEFKKALFQDAWKKQWAKAIFLKLIPPKALLQKSDMFSLLKN